MAIDLVKIDEATKEYLRICSECGLDISDKVFLFKGKIYKEIPEYPKYYVSMDGDFMGPSGNPIKLEEHYSGYYKVHLRDKKCFAHRIVLSTFLPHPVGEDLVVNHKDRNRKNNHLSNLEWVSLAEDIVHYRSNDYKKSLIREIQNKFGDHVPIQDLIKLLLEF